MDIKQPPLDHDYTQIEKRVLFERCTAANKQPQQSIFTLNPKFLQETISVEKEREVNRVVYRSYLYYFPLFGALS